MDWSKVHTYVIFARYKRSGSALLSCCLDAHPNIIFPRNELLFDKYKSYGSPGKMYDHLYRGSRKYKNKDRVFSANGYRYPIEGSGECTEPLVIGHKSSTRAYLKLNREKIKAFKEFTGVRLQMLFLVRNPFHLISERWMQKEWRRRNAPVGPIIDDIIKVSQHHQELVLGDVVPTMESPRYQRVRYETLVSDPNYVLTGVANTLGVAAEQPWLDACKKLINPDDAHVCEPPWKQQDVDRVYEELINKFWWFKNYEFKHWDNVKK